MSNTDTLFLTVGYTICVENILTDRLCLRPLQHSDTLFFLTYLPEVDEWLSINAPRNMDEAQDLVRHYIDEQAQGKSVRFVIEDKANNEFIGIVGVYSLKTDWPERHCWIRKDKHRQGYAFEAISAFMYWANIHLDYSVMYSSFDASNAAMQRLNEKLGGQKGDDEPEPVLQKSGKVLHILWYAYYKPQSDNFNA